MHILQIQTVNKDGRNYFRSVSTLPIIEIMRYKSGLLVFTTYLDPRGLGMVAKKKHLRPYAAKLQKLRMAALLIFGETVNRPDPSYILRSV